MFVDGAILLGAWPINKWVIDFLSQQTMLCVPRSPFLLLGPGLLCRLCPGCLVAHELLVNLPDECLGLASGFWVLNYTKSTLKRRSMQILEPLLMEFAYIFSGRLRHLKEIANIINLQLNWIYASGSLPLFKYSIASNADWSFNKWLITILNRVGIISFFV